MEFESIRRLVRRVPALWALARVVRALATRPRRTLRACRDAMRHVLRRARSHHGTRRDPGAPLHVVIVATAPGVREVKLAKAAASRGVRVSLVSEFARAPEEHGVFERVVVVANAWQALDAIAALAPDVVHLCVALWDRYRFVRCVLRGLARGRPGARPAIVHDQYDCLAGMLRAGHEAPAEILAVERECFARADHVCSRHLEPIELRRLGYRVPRATFFADYCEREPRARPPRSVAPDEELRIVYSGGIWPEDRYARAETGYAQYLEIGRALAAQRIHLHLYPAPHAQVLAGFDGFFARYREEAARNSFFHIHRPVAHAELLARLGEYDAALHVYGPGIDTDVGRNSAAKIRYCSANKLFDFVAAGLPVLIHGGLCSHGLVRRYGRAVRLAHIDLARSRLVDVLSRPAPANGRWATLAAQAPRLAAMYVELARKDCPPRAVRADRSESRRDVTSM